MCMHVFVCSEIRSKLNQITWKKSMSKKVVEKKRIACVFVVFASKMLHEMRHFTLCVASIEWIETLTWLVPCECVGLTTSPGELTGEYGGNLAVGCLVGMDVGDNVAGDVVTGLCTIESESEFKWINFHEFFISNNPVELSSGIGSKHRCVSSYTSSSN